MIKQEALALYRLGRRPTITVLLAQSDTIRQQAQHIKTLQAENVQLRQQLALAKHHPATPSGMQPVYAKSTVKKRCRRPGAKPGHIGHYRPLPLKINNVVEHTLTCCPDCQGPLSEGKATRSRYIEDIPPIEPLVTQHILHRYWCRACNKAVEPVVIGAFPRCILGNNLLVFTSWLHYSLGVTVDKVVELLNVSCHFKVTAGGLQQAWQRLAHRLNEDYKQLAKAVKTSPVLHADETGWRVSGRTHWLWCFTHPRLTYYAIERNRGSPVVLKVLGTNFAGVLVTDFYAAYNAAQALFHQRCLAHLDREIEKVDLTDDSLPWKIFRKKLRRWIRDARALGCLRDTIPSDLFQHRRNSLEDRLVLLGYTPHLQTKYARRLAGRLHRFRHQLLTFLDRPGIPSDNNHAERQIRPAVIIRKNSFCNRSKKGARVQATMMSIFQTLRLRSIDPMKALNQGVAHHLATGQRPLAASIG